MDATKTMVQAFITSRLDSCNALYYGISDELMRRLQSVQNAAARLITGTRRCDHITPVLPSCTGFRCGSASTLRPSRLFTGRCLGTSRVTWLMIADARARRLRSADNRTLAIGRTQSTFSDRTFTATAPQLWNTLPPDLRQPGLSYGQFRRSLKTFLFGQ